MSAPVIVQPDVEAWVIANTRDLPGVTVFSYAATQLDRLGWVMAVFVQLDARRKSKPAARDVAERARQRMCSLGDVPWPDGTICYSQPVEGPFYLPDDDGQPRYTARYEIRAHPVRPSGALPEGA